MLENNQQRTDLFGLANKANEVSDYSINFIAASKEGVRTSKTQIRQIIQLKTLTRVDSHPQFFSANLDNLKLIQQ